MNNPYALPRRCVIDGDNHAILHQIITIEHVVWGIIEDSDGSLRKMNLRRVTLEPVEGEQ